MSNNEKLKFEKWISQIRIELILATCHFNIWKQLRPTTKEVANIENRYKTFFRYTTGAHSSQFQLHLNKILDHRRGSISIFGLIKIIEKHPTLLLDQNLDLSKLKAKLAEKEEIFKRLKTLRDKELVHMDERFHMNNNLRDSIHIYYGEVRTLLDDLAKILIDISVAHNGVGIKFEPQGINDTTRLLETLSSIECER